MTHRRAVLILGGAGLMFAMLASTPAPAPTPVLPAGAGDVATFEKMESRLRGGESYYEVFGDELRRRGYPAKSVFNWRTPLLLSALAHVPEPLSRGVLALLCLFLFAATLRITAHEPLYVLGSNFMQVGAVLLAFKHGALVLGEVWAGLLIGLSVCMFACRRPRLAIALGLIALFLRELAAPYCAACAVIALAQRRWREVGGWLAGACLYGAYYLLHYVQVRGHQLPTDFAHQLPWWNIGDLTSLLGKGEMHAWLLLSPLWVTALALSVVTLAVFMEETPLHVRLATGLYVGFFLVAGLPFNNYWGLIAWPAWAVASGYGLQAVVDAVRKLLVWKHTPLGAL
jgi:hypothetical protein